MTKKVNPGNNAFGDLVKPKLTEKGWSQRRLGQAIHRGSSYMSYLVRGENPGARGNKFWLRPDVVTEIARELGIPLDDAFRAAGIEPGSVRETPVGVQPVNKGEKGRKPKEAGQADQRLFDIAYRAVQEALRTDGSGETVDAVSPAATRVKIDLGKNADLVLTTDEELTADEIARYTLALQIAYESVRAQIEADKARE